MGECPCLFQGQILANDVAVEETEVIAQNGRIYTLNGVLIPPSIVPILPHRCDETKREMKLVRESGKFGTLGLAQPLKASSTLCSQF